MLEQQSTQEQPTEASADQIDRATKSLGGSLVFSAIRCTLQYVLFPFVLPLLGLTGTISTIITLVLSLFAVGLIVYNIIELWPTSWRWRYLGMGAVMLLILAVFLVEDINALIALS